METRSVSACRALLAAASVEELPRLIRRFASDERAGVADAVAQARRRVARHKAEIARVKALLEIETTIRESGATYVAGVDEVGRGALAGPLSAGAVVLPADVFIESLNDSKQLLPHVRERVSVEVRKHAVAWHVAHVEAPVIDRMGVTAALRSVMQQALAGLSVTPDHVVVDGLRIGSLGYPETAVVKGDARVACVAAASCIAKVERDAMMVAYATDYPLYLFHVNKGYSTPEHLRALSEHGPCDLHRRCYAPCNDDPTLF